MQNTNQPQIVWNTKYKKKYYGKLVGLKKRQNTNQAQTGWNSKYEIESKNKICLENTRLGASQKGERLFQLFIITGLPLPQNGLPYRNLQLR